MTASTRSQARNVDAGIPPAWSAEELAAFLTEARSQRLYPALHLTAYTGMHRGEIAGRVCHGSHFTTSDIRTLPSY